MPKTMDQKRQEADERRQAYARRTPKQQFALVRERPGRSRRETAKLIAQMGTNDG